MAAIDIKIRKLEKTGGGRIMIWLVEPDPRPYLETVGDHQTSNGWRAVHKLSDRKCNRRGFWQDGGKWFTDPDPED